jgi:hypothetical protein
MSELSETISTDNMPGPATDTPNFRSGPRDAAGRPIEPAELVLSDFLTGILPDKPTLLTYSEWLQARIRFLYIERLELRRANGPRHSEKRRAQWRAYKNTAKGQASRARYERSPGARETRARYEASMPGIMARTKAQLNARGAAHAAQWDALNAQAALLGSFDADR